jgi:hypothetical protein
MYMTPEKYGISQPGDLVIEPSVMSDDPIAR